MSTPTPTPLLLVAGQVVPPYLAGRLTAGARDATIDQNGSDFTLFEAPPDPDPIDWTLEPPRLVYTPPAGP